MGFGEDILKEIKRNELKGRCLHFKSGDRCNEFINAHSIQKSNQLRAIAEDGHVYRIRPEYGGQLTAQKIGLGKSSIFNGFCKHHDNELFKPIDDFYLVPNPEQIALYSYRCLCREYFVKENAKAILDTLKIHPELFSDDQKTLRNHSIGHSLGFHRLQHHKKYFDAALRSKKYCEFEYITFTSDSPWNIQLSGVLYPEYDFCGETLQDLGDLKLPMDFITFFTAPLSRGWSITFCWHASSNKSCISFVNSLKEAVRSGAKMQDALLRLSFSCCENHAFRISWWKGLPSLSKEAILTRMQLMADPDVPVPSDYLSQGLEGMVEWDIGKVYTSLI